MSATTITNNTSLNTDIGGSISCVVASDNVVLPVSQLAHALGYDGSGNLITDTVVFNGKTYVQTLTYTSGNLTGVSAYVVQP